MQVGSKIRLFFIIVGIMACLGVGSRYVELKNPDQERIINPTNPIHLPKVNVSKR